MYESQVSMTSLKEESCGQLVNINLNSVYTFFLMFGMMQRFNGSNAVTSMGPPELAKK